MRELVDDGTRHVLSLEVLSALQRCATNEPLFPNLATFRLWAVDGELAQFVPPESPASTLGSLVTTTTKWRLLQWSPPSHHCVPICRKFASSPSQEIQ